MKESGSAVIERDTELLILGLGNVLCGDDGAGVLAIHQLLRSYRPAPGVLVLDGGTLGLALLPVLGSAKRAILVDAVQADAPAGSLLRLQGDDVTQASLHRLSPHQVGVADLLGTARLIATLPSDLTLAGIVPDRIELSVEASVAVRSGLGGLVELVLSEARARGFAFSPKDPDGVAHCPDRSPGDVVELLRA